MKLRKIMMAAALTAASVSPALAADAGITPAQKTEIQKIIHEYLISNPEVLVEVSQALQEKQQQNMQMQSQAAIQENAAQLFADKWTVLGNPKGDVTLVEFFDYQCIHCKKMAPVISDLLKKDKNLRVIYKEYPIFGESSDMASKAALAAAMQNKYAAMHEALFKQTQRLNADNINEAAKSAGLDMNKFKTDMDSQTVKEALESNRQLAEKLHLMGTPAFIVASTPNGQFKKGSIPTFIPGAASEETLQELIQKASKN